MVKVAKLLNYPFTGFWIWVTDCDIKKRQQSPKLLIWWLFMDLIDCNFLWNLTWFLDKLWEERKMDGQDFSVEVNPAAQSPHGCWTFSRIQPFFFFFFSNFIVCNPAQANLLWSCWYFDSWCAPKWVEREGKYWRSERWLQWTASCLRTNSGCWALKANRWWNRRHQNRTLLNLTQNHCRADPNSVFCGCMRELWK